MYELVFRVVREVRGNVSDVVTLGYIIKDIRDGTLIKCNLAEFKALARQKKVKGVVVVNDRLCGKGLRCAVQKENCIKNKTVSPVKNKVVSPVKNKVAKPTKMKAKILKPKIEIPEISVYTGVSLQEHINSVLQPINNARSELQLVLSSIQQNKHKITILTGTRRTGKTILSLQAIKALLVQGVSANNVCYIHINVEVPFGDLYAILTTQCNTVEYIVIDEITRCYDLITYAAVLSDNYCLQGSAGHRLLLTGTDSFVFSEALRSTLYGRTNVINTTLLRYKDYNKLFNKGFADYFKYANMLEDYNLDFEKDVSELLSLTFCSNICTSMLRNKQQAFLDLQETSYEDLLYYVYQILVKEYAVSLSNKHINGDSIDTDAKSIRKECVRGAEKAVYAELVQSKHKPNPIKNQLLRSIYEALASLGVLYRIVNIYKDGVAEDGPSLQTMYIVAIPAICYAISTRYNIALRTIADSKNVSIVQNINYGHQLENAVIANIIVEGYTVKFYRDASANEVDCVVYTATHVYLIEIKSSKSVDTSFCKHINNTVIRKRCIIGHEGKELKTYVIYTGATQRYNNTDFVNASDFLLHIRKYLV